MSIKSLGYVIFDASDLAVWGSFGCEVLGLMKGEGADHALQLRLDDRPFRFLIRKSDRDGFVAAGWEVESEQAFASLVASLRSAGVEVTDCSADEAKARHVRALARCTDPSGNGVELFWGRVVDYKPFVSPAGVSGFVTGELGLGHVVLPTKDLGETHDFYREQLGFADTDYIRVPFTEDPDGPAAQVMFMHCDNPRHHSVALTDMPQPSGAVHIMIEASTLDDVGYAYDRAQAHGAHISATIGRHTNDRMVSFYVRTPGGFDIEFGCNGWQVDWSAYVPTISLKDSAWGHKWAFPEQAH